MQVFLVSLATVAVAEMGDRTQLLTLVLSAKFRKPLPILAGIFAATAVNHAFAALLGVWFAKYLTPHIVDIVVGISLLAMALWALIPDRLRGETRTQGHGAFAATAIAFFLAEIGDKTQIATAALAAGYNNLPAVVLGSTTGMLLANIPVVYMGSRFAQRLPLGVIHKVAAALFAVLGLYFLFNVRAGR